MLSRLAITFLPRSKRLLISWLQSPSAVTLEPKNIKSFTVSPVFPHLFAMKWWDGMLCSLFFKYWVLSRLFHSPFSLSRGSLVPPCFLPCIHVIKPLCDFSFANHVKLTQISQKNPAAQKESSSFWLEQPHYFSPFYNQYVYFGFSLGFLIPCSLLWLCSLAKKVLFCVVCIVKRINFFLPFYNVYMLSHSVVFDSLRPHGL